MEEFDKEIELIEALGLKTSPLRLEYEKKVHDLQSLPEKLKAEGCSEEQIAREMYEQRRELGRRYKEAAPPLFREYIYAATAAKYGDPLGPTYETLREGKTCEQIIESASRPIEDLDNRLTLEGFQKWYETARAVSPSSAAAAQRAKAVPSDKKNESEGINMKITKRNGNLVIYDDEKLVRSILKANSETDEELSRNAAVYLSDVVIGRLAKEHDIITTALIRDGVYHALIEKGLPMTAQHYRDYSKTEA